MLPTSCGELFSFRQHPEALMRRQTRPFTVEIKNSRKPASIRKPVPTIADRPRTDLLSQDLRFGDARETVKDRSPGQEAALSEAHQVFSRLAHPTPVPARSFAPLRFAPQGPEGEAVALEQPQKKRGRLAFFQTS